MRLRRLALAPAALVVAGLVTSGCAQQSAAVRVNDQTVSRTELYEELDTISQNTEFQNIILAEDADPGLIPGKLGGSYSQPFVGEVIRQRVIGMLAAEALTAQGIELTDQDIQGVDDQLAQAMADRQGDIASLPARYRTSFVTGIAAASRLNQELGDDANQALQEAADAADISVSSEFGSWDTDQLRVVPPPGSSSSGGSGAESTSG